MRIKIEGGPDDLVRRLDQCDYCPFEEILPPEQRKIKVLDLPIPKNHIHRITIEQICGKNYDGVCPMKYLVMRVPCDDSTAVQMGDLMIFRWDLGKKLKADIEENYGGGEWAKNQDLGRGRTESYAERFRDIWNLGERKDHNILDARFVYELVVSEPETYNKAIELLETLKQEHEKRDSI